MGNKLDVVKQNHREFIQDFRTLNQLSVQKSQKHSLPFGNKLPSRLCTAIILSRYAKKKRVVKLLLILSSKSRAFIITQEGLPGFLMK